MSKLKIDTEKCTGCGLCVKSCGFSALEIENDKAKVNDNCTLCSVCVENCPFDAIRIDKQSVGGMDVSLYSGVWVFAEQQQGEVLQVVYELLGKGEELAIKKGCPLTAVLLGDGIKIQIPKLFEYGADRVIYCEDPQLAHNLDEDYTEIITNLIEEHKPEIFLFGATGYGRSLAPRVAARVGTGLTADCTMLDIDSETGLLRQTRPAFGGNLMATIICPKHRPQMATVRPGVMLAKDPGDMLDHAAFEKEELDILALPMLNPTTRKKGVEVLQEVLGKKVNNIADAEIIVSAGRGIGSQKNMILVKRLAELIGAHVGVSRPMVDVGWSEYKNQIGQTGSSVSPKLMITCGISGSVQHLAGIGNAHTIIAINSDPEAPIFSVADYKVVGDCVEILKKLIAAFEESEPKKQIDIRYQQEDKQQD